MDTRLRLDITRKPTTNCNYTLTDEHALKWLEFSGGLNLLDGICHSPSRLELAWEAAKRSLTTTCNSSKKSKTTSTPTFPKMLTQNNPITSCQDIFNIKLSSTPNCQNIVENADFLFGKAPIYRVRSNPAEIQHDILHNGPVLAMMRTDVSLNNLAGIFEQSADSTSNAQIGFESVKILGWGVHVASARHYWLVETSTGEIAKVRQGSSAIEDNVMAIVPAKLERPEDPTSPIVLP
jgi:hypothetical protein